MSKSTNEVLRHASRCDMHIEFNHLCDLCKHNLVMVTKGYNLGLEWSITQVNKGVTRAISKLQSNETQD